MQFNSYVYLLFLTGVVAVFWAIPVRARRAFVVAASIAFYASWNPAFVALPLLVCGVSFACAARIRGQGPDARRWLLTGIGVVVAVLLFFKYRDFLWNIASGLIVPGVALPQILAAIALPLGISFYSFEAISYLIDTHQGRANKVTFVDLLLFVMFWPHMIAGPIVRIRELVPQLGFNRPFEMNTFVQGMDRLMWGLVQKNVFANSLGSWVDLGFLPNAASSNSTVDNWALAVAFGLQIYFDFAAYSNIAIGCSKLIGIQLPENFRSPYHAVNPAEFWSRWHMTLSRWIRDYIFFPLSIRYKSNTAMLFASLIAVMGLVGLWHGAGWGFIIWGLMHGCFLVAYRAYEGFQTASRPQWPGSFLAVQGWRIATLLAVAAAWVPFRSVSLEQTLSMLATMLVPTRLSISYSVNFYLVTLLVAAVCFLEPFLETWFTRLADSFGRGRLAPFRLDVLALRPAAYALAFLFFMIFDDQDSAFIYFQF